MQQMSEKLGAVDHARARPREVRIRIDRIDAVIANTKIPEGLNVTLRGMVQGMRASFRSFAIGLTLSVVLLYLIIAKDT